MSAARTDGPLGVGVIGCGNISAAYLGFAPLFRDIEIRAVADIDRRAAESRAAAFGVEAAESVDALLAREDVDIALNLTVPLAHAEVSRAALEAGKHVFSEKPFVLSSEEGRALGALADERGLRLGSAPDTFLGAAQQRARAALDAGAVGRVTGGTAHVLGPGLEHWHPNPRFFYRRGAGPMLDIGPYYVTALVHLLGPIRRVVALAATPRTERPISSAPLAGETIDVEVPTTVHAVLEFVSGALVTLGTSWDVHQHGHGPIELYGERGTFYLPDPNYFGGEPRIGSGEAVPAALAADDHPFGVPNHEDASGPVANYRSAGLADMARAIRDGRPHRCAHALALHAVETMNAVLEAAERGVAVELESVCERPAALDAEAARALLV